MTGVMLPLLAAEFGLGAVGYGVITAASLFGILVGASLLGGLADAVGRRAMFIAEMMIFTTFLVLVASARTGSGWWCACSASGLRSAATTRPRI